MPDPDGIDELYEKEKQAHPNARFLDGALLRDPDTKRTYPVILTAVHYEDPVMMEIRMAMPRASLTVESIDEKGVD